MKLKPFCLLLLIILSAMLTACSSETGMLPPTSLPATPTLPPASINITRNDYEAALAKWQSQRIEEYEIEISEVPHASNIARSHFFYVRGPYRVSLLTPWPASGAIPTPVDVPTTEYPTPIDSLFAKVEGALKTIEAKGEAPWVFKVEFDPTLGYPSYYQKNCLEYGYRFCPTDSFTSQKVVRLEVLKRQQP